MYTKRNFGTPLSALPQRDIAQLVSGERARDNIFQHLTLLRKDKRLSALGVAPDFDTIQAACCAYLWRVTSCARAWLSARISCAWFPRVYLTRGPLTRILRVIPACDFTRGSPHAYYARGSPHAYFARGTRVRFCGWFARAYC